MLQSFFFVHDVAVKYALVLLSGKFSRTSLFCATKAETCPSGATYKAWHYGRAAILIHKYLGPYSQHLIFFVSQIYAQQAWVLN
jgi:hypothetical protein